MISSKADVTRRWATWTAMWSRRQSSRGCRVWSCENKHQHKSCPTRARMHEVTACETWGLLCPCLSILVQVAHHFARLLVVTWHRLLTLTAVQAQLPRVWQGHNQGRVCSLAGIGHQLLCQLTDTAHVRAGTAIVWFWLKSLPGRAVGSSSSSSRNRPISLLEASHWRHGQTEGSVEAFHSYRYTDTALLTS